jgi:putative transposase
VAADALADELYTVSPSYGVCRMTAWLRCQGYTVNPTRICRLLRQITCEAIHLKPRLSQLVVEHAIDPYFLRGMTIARVNQAWSALSRISSWRLAWCT